MRLAVESLRKAYELSLAIPNQQVQNSVQRELRNARKIDFLMRYSVQEAQTKDVLADTKKKLNSLRKLYVVKKVPKPEQAAEKNLYPQLARVVETES